MSEDEVKQLINEAIEAHEVRFSRYGKVFSIVFIFIIIALFTQDYILLTH